jgi:hypothetical protein
MSGYLPITRENLANHNWREPGKRRKNFALFLERTESHFKGNYFSRGDFEEPLNLELA